MLVVSVIMTFIVLGRRSSKCSHFKIHRERLAGLSNFQYRHSCKYTVINCVLQTFSIFYYNCINPDSRRVGTPLGRVGWGGGGGALVDYWELADY